MYPSHGPAVRALASAKWSSYWESKPALKFTKLLHRLNALGANALCAASKNQTWVIFVTNEAVYHWPKAAQKTSKSYLLSAETTP
jgi:hypothetical protein